MKSMTGFGRGEAAAAGVRCVVECSSVNRKGAEINAQLPRELASIEFDIREEVLRSIARGRVAVVVTIDHAAGEAAFVVDRQAAHAAARQLRALQDELSLDDKLDAGTLVALPGVLQAPAQQAQQLRPIVGEALRAALGAMCEMRRREGAALAADLRTRLASLRALLDRMRELAPQVTARYRGQLRKRLAESGVELPFDDQRLLTEVAIFAERCDVSEELTRIASHLDQFAERLDAVEPAGRALEFLAQEIFRELNTIGAKAGDSALARLVVEAKVELDKIREQSLNVE